MTQYPVNLHLEGRSCLVVGGGEVAARKVAGLVEAGATVSVVAPRIGAALELRTDIEVHRRPYRTGDLHGHWLAIAATDDPATNATVFRDGEEARVWVNGADDPAHCSFTLPSVLRRGDLVVAVSTGGRSPALARWLRQRLAEELGPEYETLLELLAAERAAVKADGRSTEQLDWAAALDSQLLGLIRDGDLVSAQERLSTCLSSSSA